MIKQTLKRQRPGLQRELPRLPQLQPAARGSAGAQADRPRERREVGRLRRQGSRRSAGTDDDGKRRRPAAIRTHDLRPSEADTLSELSYGAPDRIRTCDLRLRRATLYPTELRAHGSTRKGAGIIAPSPMAVHLTHGTRSGKAAALVERPWVYFAAPSHRHVARSRHVSAKHDRKFFDTFMLVLGILAAVTIGLHGPRGYHLRSHAKRTSEEDPVCQHETSRASSPWRASPSPGRTTPRSSRRRPRRRPLQLSTCGGEQVYKQVCTACHGAGFAGAPKTATRPRGRHVSLRAPTR